MLSQRRTHAQWPITVAVAAALFLAACGTGGQSPSPYQCGTAASGHCHGIAISPPGTSTATGVWLVMNTLSKKRSLPGNLFFTDETWLTSGSNDILSWVEAGQIYDRYQGLQYFWAEMNVPANRDLSKVVFHYHLLGPITAKDETIGSRVSIRRTAPDTFAIRIVAAESSYSAQTINHMWTRSKDYGQIHIGLELAGTNGAKAQPVSFQPRWWDPKGVQREWSPPASGPPGSALKPDPPIQAGWLLEPGPNGAVLLTSCCTPPTQGSGRIGGLQGYVAAARPLAQQPPGSQPPVQAPVDHPPAAPVGLTPNSADLVDHPDALPEAVRNGLLGKTGATSDPTLTTSRCGPTSAAAQQLPGGSTAGLDQARPLCWSTLSGDFQVASPPVPGKAPSTFRFNTAYVIFDGTSHRLLSAGAFNPA
jgi:hypothetical protein